MKRSLALFLAAIMLLGLFAGCKDDKTPSANDGGTTVTPGGDGNQGDTTNPPDGGNQGDTPNNPDNKDPDTPKPDAEPPAPVVEPTYVNMMVWGDSVTGCGNMMDTLVAFAKADGIIVNSYAGTYDNRNEGTTYSLYELYKFDGSNADSKIKNINETGAGHLLGTVLSDTDISIDYFLMLVSRERGIAIESANGRILTALKDLDSRYQENNPSGKFLFLAGPAFQEGFAEQESALYTKWAMDKMNISFPNQHNDLIKKHAQEMVDAVKTDSEIMALGDAFLKYYEKYYAATGLDLYYEDLRLLSPAGSYFTAAYLYGTIFGKSPAKIPVNAFIPEEEAKVLREVAHEIVFGTPESSVERDYDFVYIKEDTAIKEEYAHEVYPEYYDELIAAAYAYENRLTMIQYDQMNMNKVGSYSVRRMVTESWAENNSPQKFLYLDCSSFIYSIFNENFGYNFGGATRVGQYLKRDEACVFHFVGDATETAAALDLTEYADGVTQHGYINGKPVTDDEARKAFFEVLQPGDVIAYGGHVILYIGNGQVIHCAGRHTGGDNPDYLYDVRASDKLEMSPGGILRDSIDIFTNYWGNEYRYLFLTSVEAKIFRPLSLGLKPTEEAVARKENLTDIVAYKETTAFEGVTVSAGKDVTITYTVKNIGGYNRTVQIVDTLPAALKYKSGDGNHANGVVTIDVDIPAYSTKTFTYVVTVDANTADGTVIDCDTKISGVRMNLTPITVGNTLSLDEQAGVKAKVEAALKKSSTDIEFITNLYDDGFNYTLPFESGEELFKNLLKIDGDFCSVKNGYGMTVSPLFGGKNYHTPDSNAYQRLQYPFSSNFVAGDIILINPTGEPDKTAFWVYVGDDTYSTVENGKAVTLSGSGAKYFRESFLGQYCYIILRPSLTNFKASENTGSTDEPDTPAAPVIKGNVLIVGDMILTANDLTAKLTAMLGSEYNVLNQAYAKAPSTAVSRMEPYEAFSFAGSTCNGWKNGTRKDAIEAFTAEGHPEYIIIDSGRRDTLNSGNSASAKTASAIKWLSETYPNSKILVVAPMPYPDNSFSFVTSTNVSVGLAHTGTTAAEHASKINAFAEACVSELKNVSVVKVSDAFLAAAAQGQALYGTDDSYLTQPNAEGTALVVKALYEAITGKTGEVPTTPTEPTTPDTPDEPVVLDPPASSVVKGNVLIIGDMPLYANDLTAVLTAMLGSEYNICNQAYNKAPSTAVSRMEPYEVFSFSGTTCTGIANASRKAAIAEFTAAGDPEYIIFDTGRRDTLNGENTSSRNKTKNAVKWLSETYPNSKILVVATLPYPDNAFSHKTSSGASVGLAHTGTTATEHAALITAFAEACVEGISNATVVKISDAFLAATAQGIALYGTEDKYLTQPNANGSYLISSMLYKAITGKNASGLAFADGIDGAKLQSAADSIK